MSDKKRLCRFLKVHRRIQCVFIYHLNLLIKVKKNNCVGLFILLFLFSLCFIDVFLCSQKRCKCVIICQCVNPGSVVLFFFFFFFCRPILLFAH